MHSSVKIVSDYYSRAQIYLKKGELDKAFKDYSKIIQLDPKSANAFENRGLVNEKMGKMKLAFGDYCKALELDPTLRSAKTSLTRINAKRH